MQREGRKGCAQIGVKGGKEGVCIVKMEEGEGRVLGGGEWRDGLE